MARGFESKDVEFQQAEAERQKTTTRGPSPDEGQRCTIELSLCRVRDELVRATRPAHRQMLERAIDDLEQQLASLSLCDSR
jgi:hypothetical protein